RTVQFERRSAAVAQSLGRRRPSIDQVGPDRRSVRSPAARAQPAAAGGCAGMSALGGIMRGRRVRVCGGSLLALLALAGCDRLMERQIEHALQARADRTILQSPGLHVVLCGTGSPLPDKDRAGPCTAVIAGGEFVLVDVGPGAWETVDLAGL